MAFVPGDGPTNARIMVVGEAPGEQEELQGKPFVGKSGSELANELHEAGLIKRDCFLTNVCKVRPPDNEIEEFFYPSKKAADEEFMPKVWGQYPKAVLHWGLMDLWADVNEVRPQLIIALGNSALWATTGKSGITSWRGSVMMSHHFGEAGRIKVVPTYHPAGVLRMWSWRNIAVHDLRRAAREAATSTITLPLWNFRVRPTAAQVMETLAMLLDRADDGPLPLVIDIETRHHKFIACIGIGWSRLDAICIPIMCVERPDGYFDIGSEVEILLLMRALLTHPNAFVIGQNLHYDVQFFAKEFGYVPNVRFDTILAQHVLFAGLPKSLAFQSSMYCDHYCFWKDEGKEWDPTIPEEQFWEYNCRDCAYTYECYEVEDKLLDQMNQRTQFNFLMRQFMPTLRMMLRGVKQNIKQRPKFLGECIDEMGVREAQLADALGHPINARSPTQLMTLFYTDFNIKPVLKKDTHRPTCDDDAMDIIAVREPLLRDVCQLINEFRSIGQFAGVLKAKLDIDDRMRCQYKVWGTETYRYSSSKNAFDVGTNLQNISKGDRSDTMDNLPNVKQLFVPDPGYVICEVDLAGADAQVVAWEAGDEYLKQIFRSGQKLHVINNKDVFGADAGPDGRREPYYTRVKAGVHAYDYGASARTVATTLGISIHEAERFKKRWFDIHPQILDWHRRVEDMLLSTRMVENKFGFRRIYFDRIERLLPQGLAWIPQSTVAITINHGLVRIDEELDNALIQLLLQVHDSLVLQIHHSVFPRSLTSIKPLLDVTIPYPDPLIIPCGLKASDRSWGDCEDYAWPK